MTNKQTAIPIILTCILCVAMTFNQAIAVSYQEYSEVLKGSQKVSVQGISGGDGKELDAYLYKPRGDGPYPAVIALHGAGGIFPY